MPPRLIYIPRDNEYHTKVQEAGQKVAVEDGFRRDAVGGNDAHTKRTFKNPPIPCIFFPWFKDHAKLLLYFHGIGEDLHVIRKEI